MNNSATFPDFRSLLSDFLSVISPLPCLACAQEVRMPDSSLCLSCAVGLPFTDHFDHRQNLSFQRLNGRVEVDHVAAILYFTRSSVVQEMLHRFKYQGHEEVGQYFGWLGACLWQDAQWPKPDVVLPVPIHRKKMRRRGYNQSAVFGCAFSKKMQVSFDNQTLVKRQASESQTGKGREERVQNVRSVFEILHPQHITGKKVLLVDDVITTGATLESCILEITRFQPAGISVLLLAAAR